MSQWRATQVSTESGLTPTAEQLLTDVKRLIEQPEFTETQENRVPFSDKTQPYTNIIASLSDMLSRFPKSDESITSQELTLTCSLARLSLDAIERLTSRMEGALAGQERSFTQKLLLCSLTLTDWLQREPVVLDDGQGLRTRLLEVLVGGLCILTREPNPAGKKFEGGVFSLIVCLEGILGTLADIASREISTYPISLSMLQHQSEPFSSQQMQSGGHNLAIKSADHAYGFANDLLHVIAGILRGSVGLTFVSAHIRKPVFESTNALLLSLLKSTGSKTQDHLTRLLSVADYLAQYSPEDFRIVQPSIFRLLATRVYDGPDASWNSVDTALVSVLNQTLDSSVLRANVLEHVLERCNDIGSEEKIKQAVLSYVAHCTRISPPTSLEGFANIIGEKISASVNTMHPIVRRQAEVNGTFTNSTVDIASDWEKQSKKKIAESLLQPLGIDHPETDEMEVDGESWQERLISQVEAFFKAKFVQASAEQRIALIKQLVELPRDLLPLSFRDEAGRTRLALSSLYLTSMTSLLKGPSDQVTTDVIRRAYNALGEGLKLSKAVVLDDIDIKLDQLLRLGLEHANRLVRLAAGRALVERFAFLQDAGGMTVEVGRRIISSLAAPLRGKKDHLKETAIVTLGNVGRIANIQFLPEVNFILIGELGNPNPTLRGTAFQQLSALSRWNKSPYNLVASNIANIASYIAFNCVKKPLLLREFCRFISYSPSSFLTQTLVDYLPGLISECCRQELDTISKIMGTNVANLIIEKPAEVLERIFMLDGDGSTKKALDLVVQYLPSAPSSSQQSLGIGSLVKSKLIALLGRLIIQLGDHDESVKQLALAAIKKAEKYVREPNARDKRLVQVSAEAFVKQHIMGVIAYLNEEIHEGHGKRSVDAKCKVLRGIGEIISLVKEDISIATPQLVAILQNTLHQVGLAKETSQTWWTLVQVSKPSDFIPYLSLTSAVLVDCWEKFDDDTRRIAKRLLIYIVKLPEFHPHLTDLASVEEIHVLADVHRWILAHIPPLSISQRLELLASRISDANPTVSRLAILETTRLVSNHGAFYPLISGDSFNQCIGYLIKALHAVAGREGEVYEASRLATFRCLGIIGAIDPDRFDIFQDNDDPRINFCDFDDTNDSRDFAIHLLVDVLAPIFPKTSDLKFQSQIAYTIQELLRFCEFTDSLLVQDSAKPVSVKIRQLWGQIPSDVRATVASLLGSKYTIEGKYEASPALPIYPSASSYRDWVQKFVSFLISKVHGQNATKIFQPFRALLASTDVQVLIVILPHLVLNFLFADSPEHFDAIKGEILAVLEDQVDSQSSRSSDMRLLCAQMVFQLMDHLNGYLRYSRMLLSNSRRSKNQVLVSRHRIVDTLARNMDNNLMAQAAFSCRQYARALMNLEQKATQVLRGEPTAAIAQLQEDYEQMHTIYANLDEPDGMNGVSSKVLSPSLEHQIREHEANGRWTSAQSCWEVTLQQDPDNLESQIGLLRCLRNLGHFDTLRTHVAGVLARNPEWRDALEPFQLEGAWTANDWQRVEEIVSTSARQSPELTVGRLLLALKERNSDGVQQALESARMEFGQPIGPNSYRRTYGATVYLHMVEELAAISGEMKNSQQTRKTGRDARLIALSQWLKDRYDSVLPSYRTLEPILSIRRTVFDLLVQKNPSIDSLVGHYWLVSSKIARKAGHFQAAYSALLQGRSRGAPYHFIQGCKLLHANGEHIRALQELRNALKPETNENVSDVIDLTESDEDRFQKAKAWLLRVKWMETSERYSKVELNAQYNLVTQLYEGWESSYFHWALYLDRSRLHKDVPSDQLEEYVNHIDHVVRHYGKSLQYGSKRLYQTMPRMLTLWMNLGQRGELHVTKGASTADHPHRAAVGKFGKLCSWIKTELLENVDPFKWLTAFPQLISRLVFENDSLGRALLAIISRVLHEFPQQSLWIMAGVVHSKRTERKQASQRSLGFAFNETAYQRLQGEKRERTKALVERVRPLLNKYTSLTLELLRLSNFDVGTTDLHLLSVKCPNLRNIDLSEVIVPLQSSFTSRIPPVSSYAQLNQPFAHNLPTINRFLEEIKVMPSLQKPRKIGLEASNGEHYFFLCKPNDDLRKDARLMDFNSIVNKLLRASSESRRRQLHIRTYAVVPLNEECGLIEWVRNTIVFRNILKARYEAAGMALLPKKAYDYCEKLKAMSPDQAAAYFKSKLLADFTPRFHEWFVEAFPEPTSWLASRLTYSRTAAVISMVGYIIGLGDRHGENIMLDEVTGETVHCDFNCLFDKGKQFEVPELVPFRLTQNIVDGMGITGVEGPFRIACEMTMQLLRSNTDCLMSVLEAFVHDPLVEWEDAHRRKQRGRTTEKGPGLRTLALNALEPIERKLKGIEGEKQVSVSNQVDKLIQEATSNQKLGKMYIGWMAWL